MIFKNFIILLSLFQRKLKNKMNEELNLEDFELEEEIVYVKEEIPKENFSNGQSEKDSKKERNISSKFLQNF